MSLNRIHKIPEGAQKRGSSMFEIPLKMVGVVFFHTLKMVVILLVSL